MNKENIRNIAIIAHVDHGKTTLVDCMLKQAGAFRENQQVQERVLDSNDIEKERGITILSKNTSVMYNDIKINIVDTPGHADFGGEVERVLGMVDGALLIVDAAEGPMPQTRFVLSKALELGIRIVVVINKIDKPAADPDATLDKVFDLFTELTDRDDLIDFPYIYSSSLAGFAIKELDDERKDITPLLDCILENISAPTGDDDEPLQFQATTLDYNEYVGRIVIGRLINGRVKSQQQVSLCKADGSIERGKITKLYEFKDLGREECEEAESGDIVGIAGFSDIQIGETICEIGNENPLPLIKIDEPTLQMNFSVNDSPFAGQEGKFVTSRQLRKRLYDELEKNVSLRVEETDSTDCFRVSGRGELHLGVLIETMRREGYEFQVSKPEVIYKEVDGVMLEPFENLIIDTPEETAGSCIDRLSNRKATMLEMQSENGRTKNVLFHHSALLLA
ncbi:GTP-binding protein [bacterium]|nr:GTP-binding protein [bacterium]